MLNEISAFGRGWWYRIDTKEYFEIESGALGPHGDHDGWISIGENAKKLGIPAKKAQAFQMWNYGYPISEAPKDMIDAFEGFIEYDAIWSNQEGMSASKEMMKKYEQAFQDYFGESGDNYYGVGFIIRFCSHLVRVRLYGAQSLVMLFVNKINIKIAQNIAMHITKNMKVPEMNISIGDVENDSYESMSLSELLLRKR